MTRKRVNGRELSFREILPGVEGREGVGEKYDRIAK